ncbi:uncharacterized protein LOC108681021 [Hyalella azteca]|uniref:Uncharacterized protein LOC108681021 n=1 Tax=Hyalella azteca TaxID=294128 RepID=A0A8B7PIX9_HYAAZ|nr:uncharacterized protein LOC108681021 [Hyalella azteca]
MSLPKLKTLRLHGNPVTSNTKCWMAVVEAASSLEELDGRAISDYSRMCLQKRKVLLNSSSKVTTADKTTGKSFNSECLKLPTSQPPNEHVFFTGEDRSRHCRPIGAKEIISCKSLIKKYQN